MTDDATIHKDEIPPVSKIWAVSDLKELLDTLIPHFNKIGVGVQDENLFGQGCSIYLYTPSLVFRSLYKLNKVKFIDEKCSLYFVGVRGIDVNLTLDFNAKDGTLLTALPPGAVVVRHRLGYGNQSITLTDFYNSNNLAWNGLRCRIGGYGPSPSISDAGGDAIRGRLVSVSAEIHDPYLDYDHIRTFSGILCVANNTALDDNMATQFHSFMFDYFPPHFQLRNLKVYAYPTPTEDDFVTLIG